MYSVDLGLLYDARLGHANESTEAGDILTFRQSGTADLRNFVLA
jgi:hypothetical protein